MTQNLSAPARRARPGTVLAFICLGQFIVFIDVSIVNLALPSIQHSLHMPDISLNYIVTAYGTVLGGFLLLAGRMADTFGRRRMLQAGLGLFAAASLASGLARDGAILITARGFQGLGSAMISTAALSILASTFAEGPERTRALGVWGSLSGIASIAGVILGGMLAGGPGWRWIFWINVPIGLAAAALAPRLVPESRADGPRRFDLPGATALTAGLLLLIFTLGDATSAGWDTPRTIGSLAGAAVLLAGFGAESRARLRAARRLRGRRGRPRVGPDHQDHRPPGADRRTGNHCVAALLLATFVMPREKRPASAGPAPGIPIGLDHSHTGTSIDSARGSRAAENIRD
jgi:MFS family permease